MANDKTPMSMLRKILISLASVLCIALTLSACGTKEASKDTIQNDIEAYQDYSILGVDTTNFEIIKRKTSIDDRSDEVYVSIKGENNEYMLSRNYCVTYVLYNDGWKLEEISPFNDENYPTYTTPLIYPDTVDVESCIEKDYLEELKLRNEPLHDISIGTPVFKQQTEREVLFDVPVTYHYFAVDQTITFSAAMYFTQIANGRWDWSFDIFTEGRPTIVNTLNDSILGTWLYEHSDYDKSIQVDVYAVTDTECEATVSYVYSGWRWGDPRETDTFTAHFALDVTEKSPKLFLIEDVDLPYTSSNNKVATLTPGYLYPSAFSLFDEQQDGLWWCGNYQLFRID